MPKRKVIGSENIVGQHVVKFRKLEKMNQKTLMAKLQSRGIVINQSGLSALEGQTRKVSDRELVALAESLGVTLDELISGQKL